MWPFAQMKAKRIAKQAEIDAYNEGMRQFRLKYPVGRVVNYIDGLQVMVTKNYDRRVYPRMPPIVKNALYGEYTDKNGILHSVEMNIDVVRQLNGD